VINNWYQIEMLCVVRLVVPVTFGYKYIAVQVYHRQRVRNIHLVC
jgi:hypothetical protein